MSYPVHPEKHRLPALLTAEQMIEFRRAHGLRETHAPEGVVLCLYRGVMRRFGWKYRAKKVDGFQADVYLLRRRDRRVGVVGNFGIGAPAATNLAEELIAWGAKRLVILSLGGGLQPQLAPGSLVLCDRAVRDEGTSYHYLPPARDVAASAALVARISRAMDARALAHVTGATWSTDAPYRETREEAASYQSEGVQTVDMESAGVFAAAQVRGVDAASVLIVGDSLAGPRWSAPPDMRALHRRIETLLDTLIDVVSDVS
ncbi:MAG TPA: nucleoside phosphorylase [Candidatus Limnocylindria bacterium]|nr:nucleoside phosphorylase [Candidatus Limnocylindria bacterium]